VTDLPVQGRSTQLSGGAGVCHTLVRFGRNPNVPTPNCLEDHTGIAAGLAARNAEVAVDHYYNHQSINGKTFAGYYDNSNNAWLGHIGIAQTVEDKYDLMVAELPDQHLRKQKVLCGGHSLGGTITGFFAKWDFDGHAGADQCSGYFALDTTISTSMSGAEQTAMAAAGVPAPESAYDTTQAALASGSIPRSIDLPVVINPQTLNTIGIAGLGAVLGPDAPSVLTTHVPEGVNVDTTLRILLSRDLLTALTVSPSIRQFRLTNDAFLGGLFDNNSEPLALLQASVGFFGGGPVVDKDFPLPYAITDLPFFKPVAIFGPDRKAIPAVPNGPRYTWRNYNSIGAPGEVVATSRDGRPFTTAADEVTDIHELARSLAEQPLDFAEQYFPTKIVTDISQAGAPQISTPT